MKSPIFASIRLTCQNHDEYYASLAADGSYCNKPENYDELVAKDYELSEDDEDATDPRLYDFMMDECAPACQKANPAVVKTPTLPMPRARFPGLLLRCHLSSAGSQLGGADQKDRRQAQRWSSVTDARRAV